MHIYIYTYIYIYADELANQAMSAGMDHDWASDAHGSWKCRDILVFSDGGFRSKGAAASAAWIVAERPREKFDSCGRQGTAHILVKCAIYMKQCCTSSFMAEAIAFEKVT